MKKYMKLIVCGMVAVMLLGLAACGGEKKKETSAPETTAEETTKAEPVTEAASTAEETSSSVPAGKYATVEDFVNSDVLQNQLADLKTSLTQQGMDIAVTGEGNKLIYTYTYTDLTDTTGMAEALKEAMASQADTFKNVANSLKAAVAVDNPVVVVRYLDANGGEIYSEEFAAE